MSERHWTQLTAPAPHHCHRHCHRSLTRSSSLPPRQDESPTGAGLAENVWGRPTLKAQDARGMSQALPWLPRPKVSRLGVPGDAGFDPLGLSDTAEKFFFYREAEIKHARLAMLAAVGWPASELFHDNIARYFQITDVLDHTIDRTAPAVLNHGLAYVPTAFWVGAVLSTAAFEYRGWIVKQARLMSEDGYVIGEFGFDPLDLWTIGLTGEISVDREQAEFEEKTARETMQSAELKNGRLAMMAVLGYVVQEAWTRVPVIAETPWLFKPAFLSIANLLTH